MSRSGIRRIAAAISSSAAFAFAGASAIVACGAPPKPAAAPSSSASAVASVASAAPEPQLVIDDTVVGTGVIAGNGDAVTVDYEGRLLDGTVFDSSYARKSPLSFIIGEGKVIRGWERGLLGMRVGGKRRLTIPGYLAYGRAGSPPTIPPDATLVFDIELLHVVK